MPDDYLSIAAIVKDEAAYIAEWIAFHQTVGVERFYIYDNDSTDGTPELIRCIPGVTVYDWPGESAQLSAYANALLHHDTRWLAFLDADEFLFSPSYLPLTTVLRKYESHPAVGACWAVFGTSGLQLPQPLVLDAYCRRAPIDSPINRHVKSIVQPAMIRPQRPSDPHHFECAGVDTLERQLEGPLAQSTTWQWLRVNHYISKSRAEAKAKMLRPRADNGELRRSNPCNGDLNVEIDRSIAPYVQLLKARLEINEAAGDHPDIPA